jgi:CMP-N-acetylneuraminic acid synthetase
MSSNVLAVVPARGGSKRLPRKNLRELDGKPLVAHALDHGTAASAVDQTVLSTDDDEIASVATEYERVTTIDRPAELADDTATADQAVRHAVRTLEDEGSHFDIVCMLLPTTPFRRSEDVEEAVRMLRSSRAQSVVGVTEFDHPPFYAVETDEDGFLAPYFGGEYLWSITRSQEFPELELPNGAIFVTETPALFEHENFYTDRTTGYSMPPDRSLDIDEEYDLKLARALLQYEGEQ